jgi:riboflavin synthase
MFSGIVEKTVVVTQVDDKANLRRLTLAVDSPDVRLGQSIAVNGCCLTVAGISSAHLRFDVIRETLDKTNLGQLISGDAVNIERSLRIGDRIDGHFVQGHIDGVAKLLNIAANGDDYRLTIEAPPSLRKFLTPKGSITVDGVSLTIANIGTNDFQVALIPTTLSTTTLRQKQIGWPFNLEMDVLGKTVISYLERRTGQGK